MDSQRRDYLTAVQEKHRGGLKWLENKGFPESCLVKGYDSGGPFFCSGEPLEAEGSRLKQIIQKMDEKYGKN
jgi:hypothetical protein